MPKPLFQKQQATKLVKQFGLKKKCDGRPFYNRLEGSGNAYFWHKSGQDSREPNPEIKEQLTAVSRATTRLQNLISSLSPDAIHALRRTISKTADEIQTLAINAVQVSDNVTQELSTSANLKFHIVNLPNDEGFVLSSHGLEDVTDTLDHLQSYATQAATNLPKRRAGRRQSEALRMWVINCASVWCDHKGQATSDAASFCVTALQMIDPEIPEKKIVTAMRAYVTEQRKKESQEMGGKIS